MNIEKLLEARRSYRKFDNNKKLNKDEIKKILEAIKYASSGNNRQDLRFISVESEEKVKEVFEITNWAARLPNNIGRPKPGEEPVYFVAVLSNKNSGKFINIDKGLAISNMTITAMDMGIGSCIIANFPHDKLKSILNISDEYDVDIVVAFGYPTIKSEIKEISIDEDIAYYLDDDGNYIVPKYKLSDRVKSI